MNRDKLAELLTRVKLGNTDIEDALEELKHFPYSDLGYARIDHHREIRTGYPEVVYCEGKTCEQVSGIFEHIVSRGSNIMGTRANKEKYEAVKLVVPGALWHEEARIISFTLKPYEVKGPPIAIISAGTSDHPVAEEAAVTAELLGNKVNRIYDAGVAGIHRLVDQMPKIRESRVIIVIAGMEGALASVVGGLVDAPVIAVPTSVGYGANFNGISALLAMLTSCASGVSVVNIDNGFGAGFNASMINKL
ncbi:MAG: nickel pincer cofactor biosynthesis protein LarB [Marinilabiliaceae bacterium]|jgi:NCAIR mutase (PurE)-related protein|nr:nickel pincer cofactor biosynthesis protein LarB [Marinilabiliaceae bacterium]